MKTRLVLLSLAATVLLNGCNQTEETVAEVIRPVKFMQVQDASESGKREYPGTLQATNRVDLSFQVSGKLAKLPIKEGQDIKQGDLIGQLDQRDYKARYDSALAEFREAKANLARAEKLIKKEYISQADMDKIRAKRDMAEANVRLTKKALSDTELRAPFTGTIAKQYVRNFTDIQAKQAIVSFQNNDELEIVISVPENVVVENDQDRKNNTLNLTATFTTLPNEVFDLKLNEFTTEADAATRTYKVTLGIVDKKGFGLYPGMTTTVFASGETFNYANLLPVSAVFSDPKGGEESYIWLIDDSDKVHQQAVKIGELQGDRIEILEGIQTDDKVVIAGVHHLVEGQKVKLLPNLKAN